MSGGMRWGSALWLRWHCECGAGEAGVVVPLDTVFGLGEKHTVGEVEWFMKGEGRRGGGTQHPY